MGMNGMGGMGMNGMGMMAGRSTPLHSLHHSRIHEPPSSLAPAFARPNRFKGASSPQIYHH